MKIFSLDIVVLSYLACFLLHSRKLVALDFRVK